MARKITLSIPDLLYDKMERWRRSFNLSKIFQEAVAEAIQKKEEFQKRLQEDHDLNSVIERLREEKAQSEGNFFVNGRRDGAMWAKSASYDDIMYALSWQDIDSATTDKVLGSFFQEKFKTDNLMDTQGNIIKEYARLYLTGWQRGLEEFWNEIKNKL